MLVQVDARVKLHQNHSNGQCTLFGRNRETVEGHLSNMNNSWAHDQ